MEPLPQLLNAFFMTAARTGGFASIDVGSLTEDGLVVLMALMFVGGAAASTAGGIKVQTFSILFFAIVSSVRGRQRRRGVSPTRAAGAGHARPVRRAARRWRPSSCCSSALNITERFAFQQVLFEAFSAFSTVGLSTGITPETTPDRARDPDRGDVRRPTRSAEPGAGAGRARAPAVATSGPRSRSGSADAGSSSAVRPAGARGLRPARGRSARRRCASLPTPVGLTVTVSPRRSATTVTPQRRAQIQVAQRLADELPGDRHPRDAVARRHVEVVVDARRREAVGHPHAGLALGEHDARGAHLRAGSSRAARCRPWR